MMRFALIAALAGSLALSACGTESNDPVRTTVLNNAKNLFSKRGPQQVLTTAILRARLTPDVRASIGASVLIAELPKIKVAAVVAAIAQNGNVITWQAQDGVGISTATYLRSKDYVAESCSNPKLTVKNQYWLDQSGDIWRSKQWVGAQNGYMLLENPPG